MPDTHDIDAARNARSRGYWAFISYSSKDRAIAKWLHRRIENYPIPKEFQTIRFEDGTPIGKYLRPVFRDRDELTGAADLGPAISKALEKSRYLIVLCSRNSARSQWVNQEILEFQAAGKSGSILALIVDGEAPLAKGFTTAPISQFVSPEHSPWFALVGFPFVEIRGWQDGRLIASHRFEDLEIDFATTTAGELLLAGSRRVGDETQTTLLTWNPEQQEKPAPTDMRWDGKIQMLEAISNQDTSWLITCLPDGEQRNYSYWKRRIPNGAWQTAMPSETLPVANTYRLFPEDLPPGFVGWRTEERALKFTDFLNGSRYNLELNEGENFFTLRRTPDAVEAIIGKSEERTYEARNPENGSNTPLFGGRAVDNLVLDHASGKLAAWDREASCLIISQPTKDDRIHAVRLPGGISFQSRTIHFVSDRLILVDGYGWPANHGLLALIDCEAADGEGVYLLRVPEFEDWLEASVETGGKAAIKALSHRNAAISSADELSPITAAIRKNGESSHPGDGQARHLQIGNDGIHDVLFEKSDGGKSMLARAKPGQEPEWLPLKGPGHNYDKIAILGDDILMHGYGNSLLLDASGTARWENTNDSTSIIKTFKAGDRHLLVRTTIQGVQLVHATDQTILWSKPLDDRVEAVEVIPEGGRILIVTASRPFDETRPTVTLRECAIKDGSESHAWTLELEKLEAYGTQIEILEATPPLVLIDQTSAGSEIHDCVIYQCEEETLVERIRWRRAAHTPSVKLPNGKGFVVDMSEPDNSNYQAARVSVASGELATVPIPLPGPLHSIHPSPRGDLGLFVLEDSMFLYDFATSRAVGGALSLGRETYGEEIRPDDLYQPFWSADAEFLYLASDHAIYQLNGKTGEIIATRMEHRPGTDADRRSYKIVHTALSPNGEWLASVDEGGTTRISRVNADRFDLKTLRDFVHQAGGRQISTEGDLIPWTP